MSNEFGQLWRELEDPAIITLTNPRTQSTVIVDYVLLRETRQEDLITGDETIDDFWLTAHLWEDKLMGVIPKEGYFINDGSFDYEIKEVDHDARRQRFKCLLLRRRN